MVGMRLQNLRIIIPLLLLLSGCKLKQAHEWDVNMLTPIGRGEVSLQNMVNGAQIKADTTSALDFVYVQNLKALGLGDFLKVPDTTVEKTVSLKQISLGQRTMEDNITLGQVARNAGFTGQIILYNQGKEMAIPALSN